MRRSSERAIQAKPPEMNPFGNGRVGVILASGLSSQIFLPSLLPKDFPCVTNLQEGVVGVYNSHSIDLVGRSPCHLSGP